MGGSKQSRADGPSVSLYGRENHSSFQPGNRTVCELCRDTTRCFDKYGFTACQDCHRDLLPGSGVF